MVGMTLYLQEKKKVLLRVGSVSISVALWISHLIGLLFGSGQFGSESEAFTLVQNAAWSQTIVIQVRKAGCSSLD